MVNENEAFIKSRFKVDQEAQAMMSKSFTDVEQLKVLAHFHG